MDAAKGLGYRYVGLHALMLHDKHGCLSLKYIMSRVQTKQIVPNFMRVCVDIGDKFAIMGLLKQAVRISWHNQSTLL